MKGRKVKLKEPKEWECYGLTEEEFYSLSKGKRWELRNPEKRRMYNQKQVEKDKATGFKRQRKSRLKVHYDMTEQDYEDMLLGQDGACKICGTTKPTGRWKVFAVDHCHATGKVRGLLCNECNRGIGLLGDNPDLLLKAALYLFDSINENNNKELK